MVGHSLCLKSCEDQDQIDYIQQENLGVQVASVWQFFLTVLFGQRIKNNMPLVAC